MTDATALPGGVGAQLARAREERGLALTDVAQQLKFAARQLEALEQERFDQLPGGTFVRGMVRAYARLLKIEAEPLLGQLADRFDAPDSNSLAARYKQPVPFSDGTRKSTFVYLGASLGVLVAVGAIAYQWYRESHVPRSAQVASHKAARHAERAAPPATQPKPTEKVVAVVAKEKPVAAVAKTERTEKTEKADEKVDRTDKADKAERALKEAALIQKPIPTGVHRIVFRCEEEAWLEVKDAAGRQLISSLNPPGCERVVQGRGPFELVIGNASHVRVVHNDRELDLEPHTKQDIARFTIP